MLGSSVLSVPPASLKALEFRAVADAVKLPLWLGSLAFRQPENLGQGRTVFVLPGFGAGDKAMKPMHYFLQRNGFHVEGWGLGVNKAGLDLPHDPKAVSWDLEFSLLGEDGRCRGETGVPHLCDLMVKRVSEYHEQHQKPVSLVGWSLGGTIAREVARDRPDMVDRVVTMGAPVIGGPKYTSAAPLLASRGLNLDWIEMEVERRNRQSIKRPVTAIVSKTDGIVDWTASIHEYDSETDYVFTDVAHLGMFINREVLGLMLEALTR